MGELKHLALNLLEVEALVGNATPSMSVDMPFFVPNSREKLTGLHLAALFGSQTLVQKLLFCGHSINAKNGNGQAPLDIAALAKQNDASRILLASPDINTDLKDKAGFVPLRVATCCEATEIVQQLTIRADVDVNTVDTVRSVGSFPLLFLRGTTDSHLYLTTIFSLPTHPTEQQQTARTVEIRIESSNAAAMPQGNSVTENLIENARNAAEK